MGQGCPFVVRRGDDHTAQRAKTTGHHGDGQPSFTHFCTTLQYKTLLLLWSIDLEEYEDTERFSPAWVPREEQLHAYSH